jgi:sugar O-acyltransferase (sialic acid O-acetyltransferase NeuD family)
MSATGDIFVLGTGGLAREMAQLILDGASTGGTFEFAGFIARDRAEVGSELGIGPVVGDDNWLVEKAKDAAVVVGIGHPEARAAAVRRLLASGARLRFPTVIHPSAVIDPERMVLGIGNCITAGCVFTLDIRIGDFNLFNFNVTVGHDVEVGAFNVINPGANLSGGASIGDEVLVGTGAQVLEGRKVGARSVVGAGSVVTHDVPDGRTVVGVPARELNSR